MVAVLTIGTAGGKISIPSGYVKIAIENDNLMGFNGDLMVI